MSDLMQTAKVIYDTTQDQTIKDKLAPYVSNSIDFEVIKLTKWRLHLYSPLSYYTPVPLNSTKYNEYLKTVWPEVLTRFKQVLDILHLSLEVEVEVKK